MFVETTNLTGWPNSGVAWLIGILSSTYSMLGYDAATHLSEELPDPKRKVPIAMVGSVVINGFLGFIWCIVLLFCLGDPEVVLSSKTGFPFMQVFYDTTKSAAGATVMSLIISLIAVAANAAGLTSTSRTFWAVARDNAMPKAEYFSHVDTKLHVPVRMVVLVSILQFLLGFIYLGSTTAFNAVLSMAILGMYLSYLLPIVYMLLFGRNSGAHEPGPFKLGKAGVYVNILALCWLVLAMFFRYVRSPTISSGAQTDDPQYMAKLLSCHLDEHELQHRRPRSLDRHRRNMVRDQRPTQIFWARHRIGFRVACDFKGLIEEACTDHLEFEAQI